jgi:prophage antirepressor-like protein
MNKDTAIKLFESKKIRSVWDDDLEKWYFSIVDVVGVLTDSLNPNNYWKVLKHRLSKEGSELVTDCNQLKMQSSDGKYYKTDVADTEQLFRLIQSIPSPKAEPFKLWLAKAGRERIDEIEDPDIVNFHDLSFHPITHSPHHPLTHSPTLPITTLALTI